MSVTNQLNDMNCRIWIFKRFQVNPIQRSKILINNKKINIHESFQNNVETP